MHIAHINRAMEQAATCYNISYFSVYFNFVNQVIVEVVFILNYPPTRLQTTLSQILVMSGIQGFVDRLIVLERSRIFTHRKAEK